MAPEETLDVTAQQGSRRFAAVLDDVKDRAREGRVEAQRQAETQEAAVRFGLELVPGRLELRSRVHVDPPPRAKRARGNSGAGSLQLGGATGRGRVGIP